MEELSPDVHHLMLHDLDLTTLRRIKTVCTRLRSAARLTLCSTAWRASMWGSQLGRVKYSRTIGGTADLQYAVYVTALDARTICVSSSANSCVKTIALHEPAVRVWTVEQMPCPVHQVTLGFVDTPGQSNVLAATWGVGATPRGVVSDGRHVYVVDQDEQRLYKFRRDSSEALHLQLSKGLSAVGAFCGGSSPHGLALYDGELFVTDVNISRVVVFSATDLTMRRRFWMPYPDGSPAEGGASGVACSAQHVYVASSDRDPDDQYGDEVMMFARGEEEKHGVQKYIDGADELGRKPFYQPRGAAFANDRLYVVDAKMDFLTVLTEEGQFLQRSGRIMSSSTDVKPKLGTPFGVCATADYVCVSDVTANNVHVFKVRGGGHIDDDVSDASEAEDYREWYENSSEEEEEDDDDVQESGFEIHRPSAPGTLLTTPSKKRPGEFRSPVSTAGWRSPGSPVTASPPS